jgi:hypothetical protein
VKSIALLYLLLQCCSFSVAQEKTRACPVPESVKDKKYHPGQVWQYKARPDEQNSRITILKVESLPKVGTIIHVRVDDIRLINCTGGPEPDKFEHMPFTKDAIERSVTKLRKDSAEIPSLGGYEQWRADCGGVYTITVAEAIKVSEYTFNKGLGCESPEAESKSSP